VTSRAPPSQQASKPARKWRRGLAGAAAVVVALGAGGAWLVHEDTRATAGPDCATGLAAARQLKPMAGGELAKFRLGDHSEQLGGLVVDGPSGEKTPSAFKGRVLLVNFWATWCGPCRVEMPTLDRLQAQMGGPGFQVITVSIDTKDAAAAQPFLRTIGGKTLAFYADPKLATSDALRDRGLMTGVPTTLLIDGGGCRIGVMDGGARWDSPAAVTLIQKMIRDGQARQASAGAGSRKGEA
jgi:thiol-disulfide isomerase/thioredoxin